MFSVKNMDIQHFENTRPACSPTMPANCGQHAPTDYRRNVSTNFRIKGQSHFKDLSNTLRKLRRCTNISVFIKQKPWLIFDLNICQAHNQADLRRWNSNCSSGKGGGSNHNIRNHYSQKVQRIISLTDLTS